MYTGNQKTCQPTLVKFASFCKNIQLYVKFNSIYTFFCVIRTIGFCSIMILSKYLSNECRGFRPSMAASNTKNYFCSKFYCCCNCWCWHWTCWKSEATPCTPYVAEIWIKLYGMKWKKTWKLSLLTRNRF